MTKASNSSLILALEPGESVRIRRCKVSSIRVIAAVLSRDTGRVFSVSAVKGQPVIVTRTK